MCDYEKDLKESNDLEDEIRTLIIRTSPQQAASRSYRMVAAVKEIKRPGISMLLQFIDWISLVEQKGAEDPRWIGIKKWYEEFMPEVLEEYSCISDYEIDILFSLVKMN